jgi:signal transduction histidine kinase
MSHELRTPLNAILNFSKFLSSGMLGEVNSEQKDVAEKIAASGRHLLNLINDVLDISKIESGSLRLFVEDDVDLNEGAQHVADAARALLATKPVRLALDIDKDLPQMVGDKRRITQIMLNLVSNACKFTSTGSVSISLHQLDATVQFTVKDTGPGIAPGDFEMIFESFRQTETGLRQGEGTGLGLPIARRLAEAHGGRLWLESQLGKGTTFFLTLPIRSEDLLAQIDREVGHGTN